MPLTATVTQFTGGANAYINPTAEGVANYLLWLCGRFALEYQAGTGNGGQVIPITPPIGPAQIEFEVSNSSFMVNGQSTVTIPLFIGYHLIFVRSGITQTTINTGGSYYTWDSTTGVFTCFGPATTGELFQLFPYT
jgi:hypothetical protein